MFGAFSSIITSNDKGIENRGEKMNNLKKIRVENMVSPRSGKEVANQFIIDTTDKDGNGNEYFQSYRSIIGFKNYSVYPCEITLDEDYWDYSVTTGKYRNEWLGENIAQTRAKIKSGEYKLAKLN
jgi:hypothetical protein